MVSFSTFQRLARTAALGPMLLRAGLVGANFLVMIGLAAWLGLGGFGQLAFLWGLALVGSTLLSFGGPLVLLRLLADGRGGAPGVVGLAILFPVCAALLVYWPLAIFVPALPWITILSVALCINMLSCLASVLRGMGSLHLSMLLRDGAPQLLLALAALLAGHDVFRILAAAAAMMAGVCLTVIGLLALVRRGGAPTAPPRLPLAETGALWGSAVLGMGVAQVDLIIGGLIFPPEVLGLYALLRRIANLVALPVSVATWVSAAPLTTAARDNDMRALQEASRAGSRIALLPGSVLFLLGLVGAAALPWLYHDGPVGQAQVIFVILLCAALLQVVFASGFPVATLCGQARDAALARLLVVGLYLGGVGLSLGSLGLMTHAMIYAGAVTAGSLWLWHRIHRVFGVESAAIALWRGKAVSWRV